MNKTFIVGKLGKDAVAKAVQSANKSVVEFNVAYDIGFGQSKSTQWITCSAWRDKHETATNLASSLIKGTTVAVVLTDVQARAYLNKDGQAAAELRGTVLDLDFLSPKPAQNAQRQHEPSEEPSF